MRSDRVLFLAPYREIELDRAHPLAAALVEWNRERLATRVALGRLSPADTNALLATLFGQASVSEDFAAALFRETEGNPFFIEEVVKSLIEQGQIFREGGSWGWKSVQDLAIPQSVKEAIGRRLDRLSEIAADMLRTAAALGKSFAFTQLAAVSATGEDVLLDALDEGSAAQLVRAGRRQRVVRVHPRQDPRGALRGDESDPPAPSAPADRRSARADLRGAAFAGCYGPRDGRRARAGSRAPFHAGRRLRALAQVSAAGRGQRAAHLRARRGAEVPRASARVGRCAARDEDVAAVDEQIGDVHEARGSSPLAAERYLQALALARDPAVRASLKMKIGNAYVPGGDPRGLALLEEAVAELDPATQTNALARALALIGRYHHYRTLHRKALEYLERALALALPQDDPDTLTDIYGYLAGAHQHLIEYDESDRYAQLCIEMGERRHFPAAVAMGYEFLFRERDGPRLLGRSDHLRAAEQGGGQDDRLDRARRLGRLRPHGGAAWQGPAGRGARGGAGDTASFPNRSARSAC